MSKPSLVEQLLSSHTIISDQISRPALAVVLRELNSVLGRPIDGAIVELGCYVGTTTLFLRRLLNAQAPDRVLVAYDSFNGLPHKSEQDISRTGEQFTAGVLSCTKKQFLQEFRKAHLVPPLTYKAWFGDLTPQQLPEQVAFAFLDGDFYDSIIDSLRLVWPRLAPDGIITIDDFQRAALPGVERAVRDFFQDKAVNLRHEQNIAIISRSAK